MRPPRIIISGGGTGGHLFPAIAIANAIKRLAPKAQILFVGAQGRMEMEKVPEAGYEIKGLPVAGFDRKHLWRNFAVLMKLQRSLRIARRIVRDFKPDLAIGVGGYASGPILKSAQIAGIPTLLQEQNSYAGVANKLLAKKARRICVAYEGMDRFFPEDRIQLTGNPVRHEIAAAAGRDPEAARRAFGLDEEKPTVLAVGGSLGARTINETILAALPEFRKRGIQLIWQTGRSFGSKGIDASKGMKGIVTTNFITNMADAYSAADLVVSRAGACSISELQLLGKPSILVPSPNVAEDHQTKNAQALEQRGAAKLVSDAEAPSILAKEIFSTLADNIQMQQMGKNVAAMARHNSDLNIAQQALDIISSSQNV